MSQDPATATCLGQGNSVPQSQLQVPHPPVQMFQPTPDFNKSTSAVLDDADACDVPLAILSYIVPKLTQFNNNNSHIVYIIQIVYNPRSYIISTSC